MEPVETLARSAGETADSQEEAVFRLRAVSQNREETGVLYTAKQTFEFSLALPPELALPGLRHPGADLRRGLGGSPAAHGLIFLFGRIHRGDGLGGLFARRLLLQRGAVARLFHRGDNLAAA